MIVGRRAYFIEFDKGFLKYTIIDQYVCHNLPVIKAERYDIYYLCLIYRVGKRGNSYLWWFKNFLYNFG
jgi:hypothetical protein